MVLLGGWIGTLFPASAPLLAAVTTLYLSLIQMAALPFMILAVYFGLQRMPAVPGAGPRLVKMVLMSLLAMLLCALAGLLAAGILSAGGGMSPAQVAALGKLTLRSESGIVMSMYGTDDNATAPLDVEPLVPDNLFAVLAYGSVPSVLIGVLCFGTAVAVQAPGVASPLSNIFEGIYRALESLVNRFNSLLPLAACVMAAAATATAGVEAIALLGSFLASFFGAALAVSALALGIICRRLKQPLPTVLLALREPITVCLFSPAAVAAVPAFIQGLSVRLGFSRALVELFMPIAPTFIKAGEAMFFAVLAIFIANLYGHPLAPGDLALICGLSWAAALWSVSIVGVKSVLLGGFVLGSFGLPLEAVLPVFLLVEVLCEGARNLLSFLISSAVIALVADDLYINIEQISEAWRPTTLKLAFSRKQAMLAFLLLALALFTVFCAGVGFGLHTVF
ncbi:cation:dicarboxylase symporter family transporter [Duganella ginsengisoli]|uniref:Cation:dicarboxylase symporter family transporter n=2 Tax=Pseudoduganella ginsengisoli TaxID=1462440 RepID=A0A6L6Q1R0_9BURK|nr:cation:dicarboxylase symporter family transporter [Pseudoduganella ginsengisoli]MTW03747.1 cation:dicarboxylase symporter family transporter [Pseudoduganella ginsengisoli]